MPVIPASSGIPQKGLRRNSLSGFDAVAIGVASTGPAYSIAATLGLIAASVAFASPIIVLLAFLPMFCAALGFKALNSAEPDCGSSFVWVSRAFGPYWGWMTGWAVIVADVLVMASLAQVAAQYTFLTLGLEGIGSQPTHSAVLLLGIAYIVALTAICVRGITMTARLQIVLVTIEVVMLIVFSVMALWRVYSAGGEGPLPQSSVPSWSWFSLTGLTPEAFITGIMLMIFLYWGWDSVLSINEETRNPDRTPGLAAITSTVILLTVYLLFVVAAQAVAGVGDSGLGLANPDNADDVVAALARTVFGEGPVGTVAVTLLLLMVLTSAAASTQTTLLPTARTALSMAVHGALPPVFGRVHARWGTPTVSAWLMGVISVALYIPLNYLSGGLGILDAVSACGIAIGFYYGLTALASARLYWRSASGRARFTQVALPALGGVILLAAAIWTAFTSFTSQASETSIGIPLTDWEVGAVAVFGLGGMALGFPLMLWWRRCNPAFFTFAALRRELPGDPDLVAAQLRDI